MREIKFRAWNKSAALSKLSLGEQIAESIITKEIEEGIIDAQKQFEAKQVSDEMLRNASELDRLFSGPLIEHQLEQLSIIKTTGANDND